MLQRTFVLRVQKYGFFHYPQEIYGDFFRIFFIALILNKKKLPCRIKLFPIFAPRIITNL